MPVDKRTQVAVIGGGPAGLMAAEVVSRAGVPVDVFDAMPSVGRKFLLAGIGGLNITHSEDDETFCRRYGDLPPQLQAGLDELTPGALRAWVHELGIETFVGSSGRVFPQQMKAAPLLRLWLHRLREASVRIHVRHRWVGWNEAGALRLLTPQGEIEIAPHAVILALGGASWPSLGSDGAWLPWLQERGIDIAPLQSANCGFDVAWTDYLCDKFAGSQIKPVALTFTDLQGRTERRRGEFVLSRYGVEGGLIYAFSRVLRECLNRHGRATFYLDLAPDRDFERLLTDIGRSRGSKSWSSHLQSRAGLNGVKVALLREVLGPGEWTEMARLAETIKALPVTVAATRPIAEAISTAGGVRFEGLDRHLMLTALPGVFVAGEMLDWEAPTGGYLLTACFATGRQAGLGALAWLRRHSRT